MTPVLNKIKLTLIAASLLSAPYAMADSIDDQMRDTFNMLVNTTSPNAYNTARRGVISGGSLFIKTPTKRTNFMTATAPSFSSGCGGIDIYGGSLSFLSKDEFVETFQAIGANALGYGVKLAIGAACPSCEQIMTSLEKTAQAINAMNIDSCQSAQGLVDAGVDFATTAKADITAKNLGVNTGEFDDLGEAWGWVNESGESPTKALTDSNPDAVKDKITINVVWRAMKESGVDTAFGGDDKFLEMIMTMIGTVIVNNTSSDPESDPKPTLYAGHSIKLSDLINGGKFMVYDCDSMDAKGCLGVPIAPSKEIDLKDGLRGRVLKSLVGSDSIIQSYTADTEWSNTAKETLSFTTLLGQTCGQKIYQSAVNGSVGTVGTQIAEMCAERLATEIAMMQVTSYVQTTLAALDNLFAIGGQENAKAEALELITESYKFYKDEYDMMGGVNASFQILEQLNSIPVVVSPKSVTTGG